MGKPLMSTLARRIHLQVRQRLHADVTEAGYEDLTPAHLYIFQLPGPDGVRPTELASRVNMTKQATNHLLVDLEARGYLTRESSPEDGRAKIIRLTARGAAVMKIMSASSRALERRWAKTLGPERLEDLRADLALLDAVIAADQSGSTTLPSV